MAEEPSLSAIIKPNNGQNIYYMQKEGVEGSMLFSPREDKKLGKMEEAVIL
jgi:hypothetical protein